MVRKTRVAIGICLSVSALFWFFACCPALLAQGGVGGADAIRRDVEQEALDEAVRTFMAGDYRKAKISFEILSESAVSPDIRRKSLFSLASAGLVLAQSPEEFAKAVELWECWSNQIDRGIEGEDPRMVTPFLLRLNPPQKQKSPKSESPAKAQKESNIIKGMLQNKEREMQSLRTKLELRDREIRRLRHQLESLEEIHRKYQEKKQEASAP
ncbi:MAG: hypothetical protein LLG06_11970 [Desulfobacteraceae bacterium]|nr:hypothetical protein [Desulfobacteraceae bacterium]